MEHILIVAAGTLLLVATWNTLWVYHLSRQLLSATRKLEKLSSGISSDQEAIASGSYRAGFNDAVRLVHQARSPLAQRPEREHAEQLLRRHGAALPE